MDDGTIGGAALGVLGGAVGTSFSIRNVAGARERAFVIRASALLWLAVAAFLVGLRLAPQAYRPLLFVPYMLLFPLAIRVWNRRQERIRREEAATA